MDEPFGALDAQTREVMHDLILHVFTLESATILFVTHDVEEAIYLGQRVVLMPHGQGASTPSTRCRCLGSATRHEAFPEFLGSSRDPRRASARHRE